MLTTVCPHCQQAFGVSIYALDVQQAALALDPKTPREVIESICASQSVLVADVLGGRRHRATVAARRACIDELVRRWPQAGASWAARQMGVCYQTVRQYKTAKRRGAA